MKLSQTKIIFDLLSDGEPHSTYEIAQLIGSSYGLLRISERIREIKSQHGLVIDSFRDDKNKSMWWYQIRASEKVDVPLEEMPEYQYYHTQLWGGLDNRMGQEKLI